MIGERFGRLVVIEQAATVRYTRWRCRCDCGAEAIVSRNSLQQGFTRSCGCLRAEQARRNGAIRPVRRVGVTGCTLAEVWR